MGKKAKKQEALITLVRSLSGLSERQIANLRGLGLRKRGSSAQVTLTPEVEGMIRKVSFLIRVEEVCS